MIKVPVLFLAFNRPEVTRVVFDAIRKEQPSKLFVALDGARNQNLCDAKACSDVRSIVENIDWPCDVKTLYRDENLGCKQAVSSAIDWFFSNVEEGIILEDDCLPSPDFFKFSEVMLDRYRNDTRVMQVCGSNIHRGWVRDPEYSYHFGNYGCIWGWATWRRAWKLYDVDALLFDEFHKKGFLRDILVKDFDVLMRYHAMIGVCSGKKDTWDYQWTFAKLINSGLSISPNVNLVSNIGFGVFATRTMKENKMSDLPVGKFPAELSHPSFIFSDRISDGRFIKICSGSWLKRLVKYILYKVKYSFIGSYL